jgi:uncharacterized membrane protein
MTRKERSFAIEGAFLAWAGLLGAFVVPTLVSLHDTVAFFAGGMLLLGWLTWAAYFFYRINREFSK